MGYDDCVKGYRVYDSTKMNVTTSRDVVVIDESKNSRNLEQNPKDYEFVQIGRKLTMMESCDIGLD